MTLTPKQRLAARIAARDAEYQQTETVRLEANTPAAVARREAQRVAVAALIVSPWTGR